MSEKPMKPVKASEIEPEGEVDPDEQRRRRAAEVARSRIARREALRRNGVVAIGSPDLATRLEEGLRKRDQKIGASFRARKAARAAIKKRQS